MYPNVWNIKEILNITNGGSKSSGRSGATSDYSSLTDSQFLIGSQFWSDQIGLSQEMSIQSKNSQQNSQEVNEPKVSTNYHTKPCLLLGGDSKEKSKMPNFTSGKTKGILEQFEEEKNKTKKKTESEILLSELSQLKECMENMKNSSHRIDGNTHSTKTAVVEALHSFTKTLQGAVGSMQEGFTVQLGAVLNKLSCQLEALQDMEGTECKMASQVTSLGTCMLSLQRKLESLKTEQAREHCMMGEILSLLHTLTATRPPSTPMMDIAVQTSPRPWERFRLVSEETRLYQSLQLSTGTTLQSLGETGHLRPLQHSEHEHCRTSNPNLQVAARTEPEQAEAPVDETREIRSQKPYHTRSAMACTSGIQKGADEMRPQEMAVACGQPWALTENFRLLAEDGGSIHHTGRVPKQAGKQKRPVKTGQRKRVPKRRKKALPLLGGQGNSNNNSGREIIPAATSCQPVSHTSKKEVACFNPCGSWSQDSNNVQLCETCDLTTASWVMPFSEATRTTQKGFWQLFDFCDD